MLETLHRFSSEQIEYEQRLHQLSINAFKNQIDSHFLYNSLESINSIAEIEEIEAVSTISTALANMFRYTANGFLNESTLQNELDHVTHYLSIQNIRFQQIFEVTLHLDEQYLLQATVPKIILQPIIENAIYHGFDKGSFKNGVILISVTNSSDNLCIEVKNNGSIIPEKQLRNLRYKLQNALTYLESEKEHIALMNIHARIQSTYGTEYGISIDSNNQTGWTTFTLLLPLH